MTNATGGASARCWSPPMRQSTPVGTGTSAAGTAGDSMRRSPRARNGSLCRRSVGDAGRPTPRGGPSGVAGRGLPGVGPGLPHLEPAMVAWAEEHLAAASGNARERSLTLHVNDVDERRRQLLAERGYVMGDAGGWIRWLRRDDRPAQVPPELAGAYRLRGTEGTESDCAAHGSTPQRRLRRHPPHGRRVPHVHGSLASFEHELNLVAVAPDGSFAAHAGFTYDPDNRHGIVEPVCTASRPSSPRSRQDSRPRGRPPRGCPGCSDGVARHRRGTGGERALRRLRVRRGVPRSPWRREL